MEYKGFVGTIFYCEHECEFYGYVLEGGVQLRYTGNNIEELEQEFHKTINIYLAKCNKYNGGY